MFIEYNIYVQEITVLYTQSYISRIAIDIFKFCFSLMTPRAKHIYFKLIF